MTPALIVLAVLAGVVIGFSVGALGGGGAILAVPVLVYGLHQTPTQATTGSLLIVFCTALIGVISAHRLGNVRFGEGVAFGGSAVLGALVGSWASLRVDARVLMASFAALMLVVATVMVVRLFRGRSAPRDLPPLISRRPWRVDGPRLAKAVGVATGVGLLTGFLGVGGGFLIVPALTLLLGLPMRRAAGTSLVVLVITVGVSLVTRLLDPHDASIMPDWPLLAPMLACAAGSAVIGTVVAQRARSRQLEIGFAVLVCGVAIYTVIAVGSSVVMGAK